MFDEPEGSDLPWILTIEEDEWTDFDVEVATVVQHHDAGPKEKWSCYRLTVSVAGEEMQTEIPFHAMRDFYDACTSKKEKKGWIEMEARRSRKGEKTVLKFR